ncbi:FecI-like protein [Ketogulonicigenium vulgare Y25]|uniref:RNA polymerase sigma factor n=1 Tax=Ketogulonicigenium vulgare TaxID=92945 RepID=UPI0001E67F01|nr:sigma-70 family RNA polymerase sigma factor [Ketogulonicigenium vulgare]ADO43404.1 FecI-like protein [Ketogulonicigenium vulgare Y25]
MPHEILDDDAHRMMDLYLQRWDLLHRALRKRVGSHDLADEAMQETWFRLRRVVQRREAVRDPKAYILMVAANISIDLIRRERRHIIGHDSDAAGGGGGSPPAEAVLIGRSQLRQLVQVLMGLKPKAREVLIMNRCAGMTHREIAAQMKISDRMVAEYMTQALRHCRDAFRALED